MERPHKFWLLNLETKEMKPFVGYRSEPVKSDLFAFKPRNEKESEYVQVFEVYEDTRYEAKLRLYNHLQRKQGIQTYPPKYRPFKGTEIGKSIPILNF